MSGEFPNEEDTLDGFALKPDIAEPNIDQIPNCVPGSKVRVGKVAVENGMYLEEPVDEELKTGKHAPNDGVIVGQCMYYGLASRTSRIDHIDRMEDGSFWVHTQSSVYRVEVLQSNIAADAEATHFDADQEPGGTPAGDERLENRRRTEETLGEDE